MRIKSSKNTGGGRGRGIPIALYIALLALGLTSSLLVAPIQPAHAESLGTWISSSTSPINNPICAESSGYIYCIGLQGGSSTAVYYAQLSESGIGPWISTTDYPISLLAGPLSCGISGGYIYCIGGQDNFAGDTDTLMPEPTYYAPVSSSGVGTWTFTGSVPNPGSASSCTISGSYIYCVGELVGSGEISTTVQYAPLSSSGIGAWSTTTSYPENISFADCLGSGGYIYCLGGMDVNGFSNAVYYAQATSSGALGPWASTTSYPVALYGEACTVAGSYIYCVGGGFNLNDNAVYYAAISSSGIGAWTNTMNYPTNNIGAEFCTASGSFIYCVGGVVYVPNSDPQRGPLGEATNATYYAPITATASTAKLTVTTQDTSSSPIGGYDVLLYQGNSMINTGFSPTSFTLNSGQTYTAQVDDYGSCHFDHWADTGSTAASRVISITSDTQLVAVYNCGGSSSGVTVNSVDQNGGNIFGYYTTLYGQNGSVVGTGFTTKSFQTVSSQTYSIQADGYGNCTFIRWSDGVTSNPRTFTATAGALGFTAVYGCGMTTSTINVVTTDSAGTSITGYYATLWQGGVQASSCFSPCSFTVKNGQAYQVMGSSFGGETFSHWQAGATGNETVNVPDTSTTIQLTATYSP